MQVFKLGLMGVVVSFILVACSSEGIRATLTRQNFNTDGDDQARDVAAPKGGTGAVVVGFTEGSLDGPNKGSLDAIVRKYDGSVLWAQQFGTRSLDFADGVAVTPTGISYVVGFTDGALGFKVGGRDAYLRKYDANGVVQWTRQFGTTGEDNINVDVTLDSSGNIYVLSRDSGTGYRVRKFNSNGTVLQTITNATLGISSFALAVDSTGNIFVFASRYISGSIAASIPKLYKYNSSGTLVASPTVAGGTSNVAGAYDLIVDSSDNLYLAFSLYDLDTPKGAYLYKFTPSLVKVWSRRIDAAATGAASRPQGLALDSSDNVYVTGDVFAAYPGFTYAGNQDIFVLKYSPSGTRLWTWQLGGEGYDVSNSIAVSAAVYVAGTSNSDPNFLGQTDSSPYLDGFVVQLDYSTGAILGIDQ
jgi:hypothetical protein